MRDLFCSTCLVVSLYQGVNKLRGAHLSNAETPSPIATPTETSNTAIPKIINNTIIICISKDITDFPLNKGKSTPKRTGLLDCF